jgi:2-polyprenyl-3-methyl-5-hydroxy-6-metoxy-1,4-benzoquinol methylase
LEHVPEESKALKEIHRVLKPGGDFIISVPNKAWIFETHGANLPLLPWNRIPFFSYLPHTIHKIFSRARIYKMKNIASLLESFHFQVFRCEYLTAPMDVVKINWLKHLLRSTVFSKDITRFPFLSTSILTHCRKIRE